MTGSKFVGTQQDRIVFQVREAKRRAKHLGLSPLQTRRLIETWMKQGAK